MSFDDFTRISDNEYRFHTQNEAQRYEQEIIFRSNLKGSKNLSYDLAHSIALKMMKEKRKLTNEGKIYFKINSKIYKLNLNHSRIQRIAAFINTFFKSAYLDYKKVFRLDEKRWFDNFLDFIFRRKTPIIQIEGEKAKTADNNAEGKIFLQFNHQNSFETFASKNIFSDNFTKLATTAFQKHESIFNIRDHSKDPDPDHVFSLNENNEIHLIPKHLHFKNKQNVQVALRMYKKYIEDLYGFAKIRYIETLYGFNLAQMLIENRPLTPEIIYRINLGVGNIETQDIQSLYEKIGDLKKTVKDLKSTGNLKSTNSFNEFVNNHPNLCGLTYFELRGIYKRIKAEETEPSIAELDEWINYLYEGENNVTKVSDLSFNKFSFLMDVFQLTPEEQINQYTGKKIGSPIKSAYTTADGLILKRWIDQQELLQIFEKIWHRSNPAMFFEKLCHIICKKHLARPHPTEIYRVGALIPAYKNDYGEMQWYKVTSMVSNGRGLVSYTLEPACEGTNLSAIKLYRSTASKSYSLEARQSVGNDINPFNSPGYEGFNLSEQYEMEFFNKRSIPSWVAYQNQLEKELNENDLFSKEDIKTFYSQFLNILDGLFFSQREDLSLHAFIRKHDVKFINSLKEVVACNKISTKDCFFFAKTLYNFSHQTPENTLEYKKQERAAIEFIIKILNQISPENYGDLILALERRLERTPSIPLGYLDSRLKDIQEEGEKVNALFISLLSNEKLSTLPQDVFESLNNFLKKVRNYSIEVGENIESKKKQEVTFTGHSLGGAAAQLGLVTYFVNKNRVPLPGKNLNIRVFDDPAINSADNQAFIAYGNKHASLFDRQNTRVCVVRRQEKGDFVPIAGEEHLGAVFTENEELLVKRWMNFDAAVQGAIREATDENIVYSFTAHGTQFEDGKRHSEWISKSIRDFLKKHTNNPDMSDTIKQLKEKQKGRGDYNRTWYSPLIQGGFDRGSKSKHWQQLKFIWDLPFQIDPGLADKKRKILGLLLRMEVFMKFNLDQKTDKSGTNDDSEMHRDENGVFVVTEQGVVTSSSK